MIAIFLLIAGSGQKETKLTEGILPGNLAPVMHMQGTDLTGNEYVLVQFWAASNPQSRIENIRMCNTISKMDKRDIQLISVSLDENKAVYQGVVRADQLDRSSQFHISDIENMALFEKYRIRPRSANWLINPEGMIVETGLSPEELIEFLAD